MPSSAPSANSTAYMNGNNVMTGGSLSYGGSQLMNIQNPGTMDPSQLNPAAAQSLTNNQNLYSMYSNSAAGSAFNPGFYSGMEAQGQTGATSSMANQMAGMGLGGSSAEVGGMTNAINSNQMNWMNREQGDQQKALSGLEGLNQQDYNMTTGIQQGYGEFQSSYDQDVLGLLGMQQQTQNANNSNLYGLLDSGLGAAGSAAGKSAGGG